MIVQTLENGESFTQCQSGVIVGKEIFTTTSIMDGDRTIAQGPCALIVPAPEAEIPEFLPAGVSVVIQDESGDGLPQPGEMCFAYITVQNLGTAPFPNPVATLSSPPDEFNPLELSISSAVSSYPDFPAFELTGDCDTPQPLELRTNLLKFGFVVPEDHEPDVGRVFNLHFQNSNNVVDMPIVIGIGSACDPASELDGETYDGVEGFLSPVGAALVPEGSPVQFSSGSFNQTKTIPLKLRLRCGSEILDSDDIDPAPRIVALAHETLGPQPLESINGDNGANPGDPFFNCGGNRCEYELRTRELPVGAYVISVLMPDSRVFQAGFTLRP